jgi:hypothetical protein
LLDDFSPCLVAATEPPAAAAQIPAEPRRFAPIPITGRLPAASPTRSWFDLGKSSAKLNQSTKILSRIIRIKPHIQVKDASPFHRFQPQTSKANQSAKCIRH